MSIVGRSAELAQLQGWANGSDERALLIRGEAGIGKTRLVEELQSWAEQRGAPWVVVGRCAALTGNALPYVALTGVLRQLMAQTGRPSDRVSEALAPVLPEIAGDGATNTSVVTAAGRLRLVEAARSVMTAAAVLRPLVIVVEDVQWMARSGLELVDYLLRSPAVGTRLLLTVRDDGPLSGELVRLLAECDRTRRVEVLRLGPLARDAAEDLAAQTAGRPLRPEETEGLHARAAGNPFLVEVLARHLREGGGNELPQHLAELLTQPSRALSVNAQSVLHAVATAGGPVTHSTLVDVTGLTSEQLEAATAETVESRMLEASSDTYRFRHELLSEAIRGDVLPGERLRLHRAFATRLLSHVQRVVRPDIAELVSLVRHLEGSEQHAEAARWALTAAAAADRALAFRDALELYRFALAHWPSAPGVLARQRRISVLRQAARVADLVADREAGLTFVDEALALVDPAADPVTAGLLEERRCWYRVLTFATTDPAEGEHAVELVPASPPSPARARVLATHSRVLSLYGRAGDALQVAEEALQVARAVGARPEEACALTSLGTAKVLTGDVLAGDALLEQGSELALELGDLDGTAPAYILLLASRCLWHRDLTPSAKLAEEVYGSLRSRGVVEGHLMLLAALAYWEHGHLDEAAAKATVAIGDGGHSAAAARYLLACINAVRDSDHPSVDRVLADAETWHLQPGSGKKSCAEWLAEVQLIRGYAEAAGNTVIDAMEQLATTPDVVFTGRLLTLGLRAQADRATAARDRADGVAVTAAFDAAEALDARARAVQPYPFDAAASPVLTAAGDSATWTAEKTRLAGHPDPDLWAAAAEEWDELDRSYPAAYCRWRHAEALPAGTSHRRLAGPVLQHAVVAATNVGASWLLRELDLLTRRSGLSVTAPSPTTAEPSSGVSVPLLTQREVAVLRLAAQGMSNRAIAASLVVSPKTVDAHMSHVLTKLGVHDRVEAAARAQRLGLLT